MIRLEDLKDLGDEEFAAMLTPLTEQEQMVLMLLRGMGSDPLSHGEIGGELSLTTAEVRKIETKALETIERLNSGWRQESFVLIHSDGRREEF